MIKLSVNQNRLRVNRTEVLTSGSSGINYCQIDFDASWDGMTREVVFRAGDRMVTSEEKDGLYAIPWEVLTEPIKDLSVGVRGTKGENVVLPTLWASLGCVYRGTTHGSNTLPPTPDLVTKNIAKVEKAASVAETAKNEAEKARDRAETAAVRQPYPNAGSGTWWVWDAVDGAYRDTGIPAKGEKGDTGEQGPKGDPGEKGEPGHNYILTEADKTEITDMVKAGIENIKTAMDDIAVAGTQYYIGEYTAVSVVLPDDAEVGQMISVSWYNGATAATLSITGTMLAFDYTPSANTRSEINALWDGTYWAVIGNEMEVPSA